MRFVTAALFLVSAAAISAASPVADPDNYSDVDSTTDSTPSDAAQSAGSDINTAAFPPLDPSVPTSPLAPLDLENPPYDLASSAVPYLGPFTGSNPGTACGERFVEGHSVAPFLTDCMNAIAAWGSKRYNGQDGRQTQQSSSCVVAWHPVSANVDMHGDEIQLRLNPVIDICRTGDDGEYVSNYAYATINDGTGTYSVYYVLSQPDGAPSG